MISASYAVPRRVKLGLSNYAYITTKARRTNARPVQLCQPINEKAEAHNLLPLYRRLDPSVAPYRLRYGRTTLDALVP